MSVTDIVDEVQEQLLSVVQIAQEIVVSGLESVAEQAQRLVPQYATQFANGLPKAAPAVDRGFEQAEQWLRLHRGFAAKVGDAFVPSV